ncbi:hypothetical protein [Streptomyces rimosus]|uniref:hypothetical protein n=1 Tax=Streptomyces rimosus TaxID=1927 RepID=UPI001F3EF6E0|nr:hypothetical protein [Streptomyces rimosus]
MGRLIARLLLRLAAGPGIAEDELAPVVTAARLMVRESETGGRAVCGSVRPDNGPTAVHRTPGRGMGRLMARLLLRRLATGPGATRDELAPVVTAARLVVRESG